MATFRENWANTSNGERAKVIFGGVVAVGIAAAMVSGFVNRESPSTPDVQPGNSPTIGDDTGPSQTWLDYQKQRSQERRQGLRSAPPQTPVYGGDIDCWQVNGPVWVGSYDPNGLDGDNDGWACES